jgi:hypothetical protein
VAAEGATVDARADAFVGRASELAALREAYARVGNGELAVAVIRGRSGIGKTALARQMLATVAAERPREASAAVPIFLRGRCHERETVPYKAFDAVVDELSHVLLRLPERDVIYVLPEDAQALAEIFPVLHRVEPLADPRYRRAARLDRRELRNLAFRALRELLVRLARLRTVVVFIDDLQWADPDSFALLDALLQQPGAPELLLLATCRTEAESRSPQLEEVLAQLARRPEHVRLEVGPLPAPEAERLAAQMLVAGLDRASPGPDRASPGPDRASPGPDRASPGPDRASPGPAAADEGALPARLLAQVAREARGNPFFVMELASHLRQLRVGERQSLAAVDESSLRLDRLIVGRVRGLPEPQRRLLHLVVVAADPVPLALLARAANRSRAAPEWERDLAELAQQRLVHRSGFRATDTVEPGHDRIREAIDESLDDEVRRLAHQRLAEALEQEGTSRTDQLAQHWLLAGQTDRAKAYVRDAAQQARRQLAFDRAAELYNTALSLEREDASRVTLYAELGDALAGAGRSAPAADAYLQAARRANAERRLDLRHRAAEQLLRGGEVRRGLELVEEVLAEVGLQLAPSVRAATASVVRRLAWLRLRGTRFEERPPESLSAEQRRVLDVLWSVNIGLSVVDTLRSADFLLRFVQLALRAGDLRRVASGLAILSGILAALGGRHLTRARRYAEEASQLAERTDDPRTRGIAMLSLALTRYFAGDFRASARELDAAERYLLDHCHGVVWELATVRSFLCFSLRILGELEQLAERYDRYTADAQRTGDRHTAANLQTYQSIVWLVRDDPDRAAQALEGILDAWPAEMYLVQHFFHLYARCEQALYRGEPESAWRQVEQEDARLGDSGLLKVSGIRLEHARIRGRCAVALAATRPRAQRAALLKEARRCVRRLRRGEHESGRAWGTLIEAAIAWLERPDPQGGLAANANAAARRALEQAVAKAESAGTRTLAAAGRRRLGELLGDERGAGPLQEADGWLASQGVVDPVRFTACIAPGFDDEVG